MARRESNPAISGYVPLIIMKEGDMFVAYSPALDLSTCALTFDDARKNFEEALGIFFEECTKRGTLERALESLGWQKSAKRPHRWQPPTVVGQDSVPVSVPIPS